MQVYSKCDPLVDSGVTLEIDVSQSLTADGSALLETTSPGKVKLKIDGPRIQLTPADIAGVFPAPGSEESPDEFLPHVAINRRTLPWERPGPAAGAPWMALLLFKESELKSTEQRKQSPRVSLEATTIAGIQAKDSVSFTKFTTVLGLTPDTSVNVLYVPHTVLPSVLPKSNELQFLCHMKRKTENGVDKDVAIVVCNRLPDAGPPDAVEKPEVHTALLVSLEQRSELFTAGHYSNPNASTALIVLHHWTFTPSKGGDFEQVMQAIGYRPNGGVLRFGNLPKEPLQGQPPLSGPFDAMLNQFGFFSTPVEHANEGNVLFRGPLRPFMAPPRSKAFAIRAAPEELDDADPNLPRDYSHAAAFEIGRLLAASDAGVLEDIRSIHIVHQVMEPPLLANQMPPALQKPDWVSNPAWFEQPWEMNAVSMIKDEAALLQNGVGDLTGIEEHVGQWGDIFVDLGALPTPSTAPIAPIDIGTATGTMLVKLFGDVENAGKS
jgi:hypothetical protein